MKSKTTFRIFLAAIFLTGAVISAAAIVAFAQPNLFAEMFPSNDKGQTYGSGYVEDPTQAYKPPDLILAEGLDGTVGYVYNDELGYGPIGEPANDAEMAAYNDKLLKLAYERQSKGDPYMWYIPLYESDGKTVIGQFGVGNPEITIKMLVDSAD